jgi:GrpB-like predicted nucleotidyltransferase (UPF0157 family)
VSAEGWVDEPVEIVAYDPAWPGRFECERKLLEAALAPWLEGGIHHVGSTAVPGLAAKPVIDVMAGVRDLEEAREAFTVLAELAYCHAPYKDWMHWFCKPSPAKRTHHLHLIEPSHPEWAARLAFRDHLRAHPDDAERYAALKRQLAAEHRHDREAYTAAKTEFVRGTVAMRNG